MGGNPNEATNDATRSQVDIQKIVLEIGREAESNCLGNINPDKVTKPEKKTESEENTWKLV
jgi:hypothetical protein